MAKDYYMEGPDLVCQIENSREDELDQIYDCAINNFYGTLETLFAKNVGEPSRNPYRSAEMALALAKRKYWNAFALLGVQLQLGAGVQKNERLAFECFKISYEHEVDASCGLLGMCYLEGKGVAMDKRKGIALLREGHKKDDGIASTELACCYLIGDGVVKDENKALADLHLQSLMAGASNSKSGIRSNAVGRFGSIHLHNGWFKITGTIEVNGLDVTREMTWTMLKQSHKAGDELSQLVMGQILRGQGSNAQAEEILRYAADGYTDYVRKKAVEILEEMGSLETSTDHKILHISDEDLKAIGIFVEPEKPQQIIQTPISIQTVDEEDAKKDTETHIAKTESKNGNGFSIRNWIAKLLGI